MGWVTCTDDLPSAAISKAPARGRKRTTNTPAPRNKQSDRVFEPQCAARPPETREEAVSMQGLPQFSEIHSDAASGAEAVGEAQDAEPLGEDMGADGEAGDFEGGFEGDAGGDWGDDAGAFGPGAGGGQENAGRVSLGLDMLAVPDKVSTQQVRLYIEWP